MIDVCHIHLSKPTKYTTPRVNKPQCEQWTFAWLRCPNVGSSPVTKVLLWWGVLIMGETKCIGDQANRGSHCTPFYCEPKFAFKKKVSLLSVQFWKYDWDLVISPSMRIQLIILMHSSAYTPITNNHISKKLILILIAWKKLNFIY